VALLVATICIPLVTAASAVLLSNMAGMRRDTDDAIARAHMRNLLASGESRHRRRSVWSDPFQAETRRGFPEIRLGRFRGVLSFRRSKAARGEPTRVSVKITGPGVTLIRERKVEPGD